MFTISFVLLTSIMTGDVKLQPGLFWTGYCAQCKVNTLPDLTTGDYVEVGLAAGPKTWNWLVHDLILVPAQFFNTDWISSSLMFILSLLQNLLNLTPNFTLKLTLKRTFPTVPLALIFFFHSWMLHLHCVSKDYFYNHYTNFVNLIYTFKIHFPNFIHCI